MLRNFLLLVVLLPIEIELVGQVSPAYKNPRLPIPQRTADLLKRMTVEEKIGQLLCPMGWEMWEKKGNEVTYSSKFKHLIDSSYVGAFWGVYRADPWTKKTLVTGLNPELAAKAGNALQKYVMEHSRLGIPIFLAEESPHGHMAIGTTVFPTGIGLASTWNPELVESAASVMAREIRLQGGHISYGPVMDLSRDPRWSRVEESFGEDPVLTAAIGVAAVKGGGGGDLSKPSSVISTLKHFIAYGIPEGGHNGNTTILGQRELHENFLPPFQKAVKAGALSIMTAYNSIDGIPCTSNEYLYRDLLKSQWGFRGFVVSDLFSIDGLAGSHRIAKDIREAGELALKAGVDMDLGANAFAKMKQSVAEGKISIKQLDEAVSRVLKLKFEMGLFENPYVNPQQAKARVRTSESIAIARETARQSIILLENKNNILPLKKTISRIAVIGPNADNQYNQLGDYTAPQEPGNIVTVYEGIKAKFPTATVKYVKGVAIRDTLNTDIPAAVQAAKNAEVAIVVVGGSSARDFQTNYQETGAAIADAKSVQDIESGEGFDRASLNLLGKQQELLEAVKATGTPVIVIYIQGRPLEMNWAAAHADAFLCAWYPGQEGGTAIAEILKGDVNPSGKLPISVPKSVGQLPVYYNKKNPRGHDYVEMSAAPLYPFGFGRSYTGFEYSQLNVQSTGTNRFEVSFQLKNTGVVDGTEVVQLYLRDELASVVQPNKQLKQFQRIALKAGEQKAIRFTLGQEDLQIIDQYMKLKVEAGVFTVMIGGSSSELPLKTTFTVK
ncbi:glycoside hydrolase family 3 C-terminal domain-containing protein [Flavihumibacter sp. RY-1]|uniref:Glycoside hydrolase family 3 C-terminal domain-containing protein n=1 Tax=Flavihumibacter fluminis TaxID=2909236 RepID=A0ABS9BN26_9BACT|nr:glycoside hydrolase family 3 N-terminal domain-containing protein [Flavihumibacter fluminis]MCF1716614.1 glycoside hydrolase family 3 C-terminal domain-containing protein [Flavihumibacter fluminis]